MTTESVALLLDPERKQYQESSYWWWYDDALHTHKYIGPDFPNDDVACQKWITPRILEQECDITQTPDGTRVFKTGIYDGGVRCAKYPPIGQSPTFALALCEALVKLKGGTP